MLETCYCFFMTYTSQMFAASVQSPQRRAQRVAGCSEEAEVVITSIAFITKQADHSHTEF